MSRLVWSVFAAVCLLFMLTPLVILVLFSFSEDRAIAFPISDFGLRWWRVLFDNNAFWPSARHSVIVVSVVGAVSTVIGTLAAFALARLQPVFAGKCMATLTLPLMVPPLVLGIMLLSFFTQSGIPLGLNTVILAHLVFTQPLVILIVYASLMGFDYEMVSAARDLGATPALAFRTVTLPVLRPSIIGAALVAMAISLDDFIVTFFTIGGGNTLPTFLWGMLRKGVSPQLNIVSSILMGVTIGISVIALRVTRYRG